MLLRNNKNRPFRVVNSKNENVVVGPGETIDLTQSQIENLGVIWEAVEETIDLPKKEKRKDKGRR